MKFSQHYRNNCFLFNDGYSGPGCYDDIMYFYLSVVRKNDIKNK